MRRRALIQFLPGGGWHKPAKPKAKRKRVYQTAPVHAAPPAAVVEAAMAEIGAPAGQRVICDWPPNILSVNSRAHWSKASKPRRAYRKACWALALQAKLRAPAEGKIFARLDMFPPSHGNDDDNAAGRFKAGRDGIADALGTDDSRFDVDAHLHPSRRLGCMVFTILEGAAE